MQRTISGQLVSRNLIKNETYELISSSENLNPLCMSSSETDDRGTTFKSHMHALPPPMNVILEEKRITGYERSGIDIPKYHSQVGVNPWNFGIDNTLWKRRQPSFRFPLERVVSPDFRISVRVQD